MHCTETPTLASAREFGERVLYPDTGTGACGHYYIDRDGTMVCYVEPERIANHVRGWNPRSIGVEIVNTGRYPHWYDSRHQAMDEPYTEAQIAALHRRPRGPRHRARRSQRRPDADGVAQARSRAAVPVGTGARGLWAGAAEALNRANAILRGRDPTLLPP
jgi:hypothetical protein